jgi:hypothetical protein
VGIAPLLRPMMLSLAVVGCTAALLAERGAPCGGVACGWPAPPHHAMVPPPPSNLAATKGWEARADTNCGHAAGTTHVLHNPTRLLASGGTGQLSGHSTISPCSEVLHVPTGAQSSSAPGGSWQVSSPLLLPRSAHAGAVLNGTVAFVFGGVVPAGPGAPPSTQPPQTASAEMLRGGGWLPAPPMPGPRTGARATALPDGRALIAGGFVGKPPAWTYLNATLIFDGARYEPGPEIPCDAGPSPRCALSNMGVQECMGHAWAVGGSGLEPAYTSVWRLDATKLDKWVAGPALPSPATWVGTACAPKVGGGGGGSLYVIGGFSGEFQPVTTTMVLELGADGMPSTGQWQKAAPLPLMRAEIAAAVVDGTIFAVGGLGAGKAATEVDALAV